MNPYHLHLHSSVFVHIARQTNEGVTGIHVLLFCLGQGKDYSVSIHEDSEQPPSTPNSVAQDTRTVIILSIAFSYFVVVLKSPIINQYKTAARIAGIQ